MDNRIRIGIVVIIIGAVLTGLGFVVVNQIYQQTIAAQQEEIATVVITDNVVILSHDVALGKLLTTEDLTVKEFPLELIPRNAFTDISQVTGKVTKNDLIQGEMILEHNIVHPTNTQYDLAFTLKDDEVLLAFPANDLMSNLSVIKRGDNVDIFVTLEQEVDVITNETAITGNPETIVTIITFDAMQNLDITAMVVDIVVAEGESASFSTDDTFDNPNRVPTIGRNNINVRAYLLALKPQDALLLKHFIDIGAKFDLVLRSPTSDRNFNLKPIMGEYIKELYGLEIINE